MGIEESHHIVYTEKKGNIPLINPNVVQSKYDAQEHEFRALLWQLKDLKDRGQTESAMILEKRIQKARMFLSKSHSADIK